jgi:aspartyl-tRNA(Asn)/glutamyl-tRNA(Gln) amidotransferase subunit B
MERGEMRIEANISVRKHESDEYGTKVEVKNLNSFKAVEGAVRFELERQETLLERDESISQETRGWDENAQATVSQRSKESAHDYRYFPEPDLPPLELATLFDIPALRAALPELPEAKRARFVSEFGLLREQVEFLTELKSTADYFEAAASELALRRTPPPYVLLANYIASDVRGFAVARTGGDMSALNVTPEHLGHLVALIDAGTLSSRMAKDLLARMVETSEDPETLMEKHGMALVNDTSALEVIAYAVVDEYKNVVAEYRAGKQAALQFLVGQGMKQARGQADPVKLRETFERLLA